MVMNEAPFVVEESLQEEQQSAHRVCKFIGAGALVLVAGGMGGAAWGAFTPTGIELGPHHATAQLTLGNKIDFDLGPLGYTDKQTGWIAGAGVKITVKGIPVPPDQSALATVGTVVDQYKELLSNPTHIKDNAEHTVITKVWHDAVEGAAIFGPAGLGAFELAASRRRKRREGREEALEKINTIDITPTEKETLRKAINPNSHAGPRRRVAAAGAIVLVAAACGEFTPSNSAPNPAIDQTLNGTPFEGYAIHGELLRLVVDEAAPQVEQYINTDQQFYGGEVKSFDEAFKNKFGNLPLSHKGVLWIQGLSDNHCNIGMDSVHGAVAKKFNVDLTIDTGDMTMGGTAAEEECIAAEADAIVKHNPEAVVNGNHDSPTISKFARKYGMVVIDNDKLTQVGKFKLLGESDVNESTFGTPLHLRGTETVTDEANKIMQAACAEHPDIVMAHEPKEVLPAIEAGCAPEGRAGHTHAFVPQTIENESTGSYYQNTGTSGGAKEDAITVGVLQQNATETVCGYSATTKKSIGCYVITSKTDGTVEISDFQPTPTLPVGPGPVLAAK